MVEILCTHGNKQNISSGTEGLNETKGFIISHQFCQLTWFLLQFTFEFFSTSYISAKFWQNPASIDEEEQHKKLPPVEIEPGIS